MRAERFLLLAFAASCAGAPPPAIDEDLALGMAMGAKVLCSGVFVVGREPDEYVRNDAYPPTVPWAEVAIDVDRETGSVRLSHRGIERTARYHGDQGCTILPKGEGRIFFEPTEVPSLLPDPASQPWPTGDRGAPVAPPPEVDAGRLAEALELAFEEEAEGHPLKTRAFLVVHEGELIAERYAEGYDKNTRHVSWSMGKSITAALLGILVREGHVSVNAPAPIAEWAGENDPRREIRTLDLLRMSSGLRFSRLRGEAYWSRESDHFYIYSGAIDVFRYSIERELELPPGTKWRYRNCDPLAIGKIVRDTVEARGESYLSFPQRALFDPIGMRGMVLEPDPYGNFLLTGYDYGTPRDWARFGLLHLRDGVWEGERILPEGWIETITTPAPGEPNRNYGALWWLNRGAELPPAERSPDGIPTMDSLPADLYYASGARGQRTMVIPSYDLVVVRMGHAVDGASFGRHFERVVAELLSAFSG